MRMSKQHNKLTALERELISVWLNQHISKREIARRLNRSNSTIRDEVSRNSWQGHYVAVHAQAVADKRVESARHRHPLKNKSVYKYVLKKLRCGWSPELIAGRLQLKHPDNPYWHIHHETIYRYIYSQGQQEKRLWEYLPRKQNRRKKKHGRKSQRVRIPDRISIHDRPVEVESRLIFGHWEGDSIVGKGHKGGIHTQVERKTRYLQAQLIDHINADDTLQAQQHIFQSLPTTAKQSTTVDNGLEFTKHTQFEIPVYFCDPYASWQKATNENTNGLIRRYLPKKTDFSTIDQAELDAIVDEINNRPKKCLGFSTPQEMFDKELQSTSGRIPSRM